MPLNSTGTVFDISQTEETATRGATAAETRWWFSRPIGFTGFRYAAIPVGRRRCGRHGADSHIMTLWWTCEIGAELVLPGEANEAHWSVKVRWWQEPR